MDPCRMAQPQGQSAAGKPPWPDARLQHLSESSALGEDIRSASDDLGHLVTDGSFSLILRSAEKRFSRNLAENARE